MRFAFFAFLSFFALPAWATPLPMPEVRPVSKDDGSARFCFAETKLSDGRKVSFALSPRGELNLGLTIPKGGFQKNHRYDLDLAIKDKEPRRVRAVGLADEGLLFQMGANSSFIDGLREAQALSVGNENKMMDFPLPDMAKLLDTLASCAANNAAAPSKTKTRKTATAVPAPEPAPPQEKLQQNLFDFLQQAGLKNVSFLSLANVPESERPADFLWSTDKILGGVRERTVPAGKKLDELIGLHMTGLKKKCAGHFSADLQKEMLTKRSLLRLAQASCAPKEDASFSPVFVSILFSLTPDNVFTVFTHEGPETDRGDILAARDKIARFLEKQ